MFKVSKSLKKVNNDKSSAASFLMILARALYAQLMLHNVLTSVPFMSAYFVKEGVKKITQFYPSILSRLSVPKKRLFVEYLGGITKGYQRRGDMPVCRDEIPGYLQHDILEGILRTGIIPGVRSNKLAKKI